MKNQKIKSSAAKEKAKFRATSRWKNFRKYMKKKNKVDFITNMPLRTRWQLHHLCMDVESYQDLDPDGYRCLNSMTHDLVHNLFRYYVKDKTVIDRLVSVLDEMVIRNQIPVKKEGLDKGQMA